MTSAADLLYDINATAMQMAQTIFGAGTTVVHASYTGDARSSAIYHNGDAVSPHATPGDVGVILSTGRASDFTQSSGNPNRHPDTSTDTAGVNNNAQFNQLAGTNTYDAAWLDVDFIPTTTTLSMQFVFASEEYPEFVNSIYNDVVGVWVNGRHVPIGIGNGQISVNNLNELASPGMVMDNTDGIYNTEMDGFTVTLSLTMRVVPGVVNSIRIGIADVSDSHYDSNVLIAAGGIQNAVIAGNDWVEVVKGDSVTVDLTANDVSALNSVLTITHVNGVAVGVGSTITFPGGQSLTFNPDGTVTITGGNAASELNFAYTVASDGISDTAFVTVNTIPCFVAGTLIRTPQGEVPVEALRPGDLVLTHDDGPQPLRWIGRRQVAAEGGFAPVRIRAGTFGAHGRLLVSPQHRILIRDSLAEFLFGEAEVLVAAKDLVNGHSVTVREGGTVDYVHLLFDRHQVIYSAGLATESYLPGPQTCAGFAPATLAEICALFPELDPDTGQGYSPAARPALRGFEAQLLLSARARAAA